MAATGNKGEWSGAYVLLRVLSDGKLFVAIDENLTRNDNVFFNVLKAIRIENNHKYDYAAAVDNGSITIIDE